jgi:serine/threonine protein kinase
MNPTQFKRLEELFDAAVELPADQRHPYLEQTCGEDAELLGLIERILDRAGDGTAALRPDLGALIGETDTLDTPASQSPEVVPALGPGDRVGHYALRELIGEGGFGAVYRAEQEHPIRRQVALKIIKMGMDTQRVIARFEAERQTLALMNHPNVARVFDAGATGTGRPYFVMEYVPGEPITEYCDRQHLSTRGRLELFMQACGAVQHAHQKGIIHRDVKPSNVLVSLHGEGATVKVIDFGVAKATAQRLTEQTLFTETGELVGTPEYMSPEQAEGGADIDTRTDVYSLGIVLYELLTGSLPFDPVAFRRAGYDEIRRVIREEEPPRPSTRLSTLGERSMELARRHESDPRTLLRELRGDLDWVVMRALEKDRTRRYATSASLAADVQRYLDHEPVVASPPRRMYRVRKFVRRHRVGVTAGSLMAAAVLVGLALSVAGFREAVRERAGAVMARDESEAVTGFLSDMFREISPWQQGPDLTVRHVMDAAAGSLDEQFVDRPAIRGRLHHVIGETYFFLGMSPEAERHLKAALQDYRVSVGEEHPDIAEASSTLGMTYYLWAHFEDAERWLDRAVELQVRLLGPDHIETTRSKSKLALVYMRQQRLAEAEALLRPVLEILRRQLGPEDPTRLMAMHNLALILRTQKSFDEA